MASRTYLFDLEQQRVSITVNLDVAQELNVTGSIAFAPVLLTAARPEGDPPLGEGACQSLIVHIADHEHTQRVKILDDRSKQPLSITFQTLGHIIG